MFFPWKKNCQWLFQMFLLRRKHCERWLAPTIAIVNANDLVAITYQGIYSIFTKKDPHSRIGTCYSLYSQTITNLAVKNRVSKIDNHESMCLRKNLKLCKNWILKSESVNIPLLCIISFFCGTFRVFLWQKKSC